MPIVETGRCHRVAVVVDDVDAICDWLTSLLGARQVVSVGEKTSGGGGAEEDLAGTYNRLVDIGGMPFTALGGGIAGGPVAGHRRRFGPSLHSLAWEVEDLWTTEHNLRRAGIRITAVNVPGRHFFVHPKDTHGLLIEWTDDELEAVPPAQGDHERQGIDVDGVSWVSAVVPNAHETAAFLADLAGATPVTGLTSTPPDLEETLDLEIGGFVVRLVTPRSAQSPTADVLAAGPRFWSCGIRVADLGAALVALEGAGVGVTQRWDNLAFTDPASTFGVPFEWTGPT